MEIWLDSVSGAGPLQHKFNSIYENQPDDPRLDNIKKFINVFYEGAERGPSGRRQIQVKTVLQGLLREIERYNVQEGSRAESYLIGDIVKLTGIGIKQGTVTSQGGQV